VINLSLGFDGDVPAVKDAIIYAIGKGAVVSAAAGNSGDSGSPRFWPAAYAASIEGLLAVAAVDYNFNRAYYSNSNDYVEIAAPGGDVTADVNQDGYGDGILQQTIDQQLVSQGIFNQFGYFFFEGTSMAAPHVSGLAALLMNQGVTEPKAVEWAIEHFATDVGAPGRDNNTGFGVINPRNTLRGLGVSR
jgi:serine protease